MENAVVSAQVPAVRMEAVSKTQITQLGRKILLRNVSFSLKRGTIGALFGFSGSGKNAVLSLIAGLRTPDSGTVEIFGKNIGELSESELLAFRRENVSIVFDSVNLAENLRVKENLLLPFSLANESVDEIDLSQIAQLFGIDEIMRNYPDALTICEERKVAIARAVLTKKPLLLAFQPESEITSIEQQEILSLLQLAAREYGITVLFSTDLPHSTNIAQSAFLMHDAQLVGEITAPTARTVLFAIDTIEP